MNSSDIRELVDSLSLTSGAALIAGMSFIAALALVPVRNVAVRWTTALAIPVLLSYSLYWLPVWLGSNSAEYSAWAPLFLVGWSVSGAVAACFVLLAFWFRTRRQLGAKEQRG
ncbi:MAG TPA: hypothetical protein VLC46_08360 [Thermoanaerobaculia bacterium]|jgi:hypothetical protein|nr:hypothetical protein [Thermoanaerobaculia bacterium]